MKCFLVAFLGLTVSEHRKEELPNSVAEAQYNIDTKARQRYLPEHRNTIFYLNKRINKYCYQNNSEHTDRKYLKNCAMFLITFFTIKMLYITNVCNLMSLEVR